MSRKDAKKMTGVHTTIYLLLLAVMAIGLWIYYATTVNSELIENMLGLLGTVIILMSATGLTLIIGSFRGSSRYTKIALSISGVVYVYMLISSIFTVLISGTNFMG